MTTRVPVHKVTPLPVVAAHLPEGRPLHAQCQPVPVRARVLRGSPAL